MTGVLRAMPRVAVTVDPPVGHTTVGQWLFVVIPVVALLAAVLALVVAGRPADSARRSSPVAIAGRASNSLGRLTGLPGWAGGAALLHLWAVVLAAIGFWWDVAWHIDLGRDAQLFTPPHTLILLGLTGILGSGLVAIALATLDGSPAAWRLRGLRIPRGGAALTVLGAGALAGFPLDDLWHATYGVDVTMWGPTHLLMIGGAALSPLAVWVLLAEAGAAGSRSLVSRALWATIPAATLLGLSAFQLEFDDGVPQWQVLFQPVLIAVGATLPMVAARVAMGRGAALRATVGFLLGRGAIALLVGPALGHVVPHVPLYVGMAVCVELGFLLAGRRSVLVAALTAGGLAGTAGLASEWGFSHVWGREEWQPQLLHGIAAATLGAVGAAVVGAALGGALGRRGRVLPRAALAVAGLGVLTALIVPLPRTGIDAVATVHTTPTGPPVATIDRYGRVSFAQAVRLAVDVSPPSAAEDADFFRVTSWQGGSSQELALTETAPGHWTADGTVPTGGSWKSLLLLDKGAVLASVPVSFPADLDYGQGAIAVLPVRTEPFVPASQLLMREAHTGAAWPAVVTYSVLAATAVVWLAVLVAGAISLAASDPRPPAAGSGRSAGGRDRRAHRPVTGAAAPAG